MPHEPPEGADPGSSKCGRGERREGLRTGRAVPPDGHEDVGGSVEPRTGPPRGRNGQPDREAGPRVSGRELERAQDAMPERCDRVRKESTERSEKSY